MHLSPFFPAAVGLVGVVAGRLVFNRWFNHLSLYSLIWGTGLALFEMRLIDYTPLTAEVWMMIGYAWIAFAAGSVTLIIARAAIGASTDAHKMTPPNRSAVLERRLLAVFTIASSIVALAATLQHWSVLIDIFGSVAGVLINGYKVYRLRVDNQLSGMIPYFDAFGLTAAFMGGLYSARVGKIKLVALLPLFIVVLEDIGIAGRAKMLIAGILFCSSYLLAKIAPGQEKRLPATRKGRGLLAFGIVLVTFLVAAEFVRNTRGGFEDFYGTSSELRKFEHTAILTPSMYLYLSSHCGVFNAYWKAGSENPFPGSNTFAPFFRILAKAGIADEVPYYQKFYNIPFGSNTGTYLRELHADFGLAGILVAPYALGFFCTILWFRIKRQANLMSIALLTHLYLIIAFSYLYQATRLGYWLVSLIAALLVCRFIDRRCRLQTVMEYRNAN